jgi:hypothetical protein
MSELITNLSAFVAEEAMIASAISNTEREVKPLRAELVELESRYERDRDQFNHDVAEGRKATHPTRDAITACETKIATLEMSLTALREKLALARKATAAAERDAKQAKEYEILAKLVDALEPALALNEQLAAMHDAAGAGHRPLTLPWLNRALLDSQRTYAKSQVAPPTSPELPKGNMRVLITKSLRECPPTFRLQLCSYHVGEVAAFPTDLSQRLIDAGFAIPAPLPPRTRKAA